MTSGALLKRGEMVSLAETRLLLQRVLNRVDGIAARHPDVADLRAVQTALQEQHAAIGRLIAPDEG